MIRTIFVLSGTLLFAATVAASAEPIVRKAGEWEITLKNGPRGPMTQKVCFATDKTASELNGQRGRMKECSPPTVTNSGSTITIDTSCTGPNSEKATIHSVITPSGTEAFHSETRMHLEGMEGMPDMTMVSDAKRIGPCQPGDKQTE